jgi:hypothetical protein
MIDGGRLIWWSYATLAVSLFAVLGCGLILAAPRVGRREPAGALFILLCVVAVLLTAALTAGGLAGYPIILIHGLTLLEWYAPPANWGYVPVSRREAIDQAMYGFLWFAVPSALVFRRIAQNYRDGFRPFMSWLLLPIWLVGFAIRFPRQALLTSITVIAVAGVAGLLAVVTYGVVPRDVIANALRHQFAPGWLFPGKPITLKATGSTVWSDRVVLEAG